MHLSAVTVIIAITVLAQVFIGLTVLIDGVRHKKNNSKLFFLVVITSSVWTLVNLPLLGATDSTNTYSLAFLNFFNIAGYTTAIFALTSMLIFVAQYPEKRKRTNWDVSLFVIGFLVALGTLTPLVSGAFTDVSGNITYSSGPLTFTIGVYILLVAINIVLKLRTKNDLVKKQVQYIRTGLTLTVVHAGVFIIIAPIIFGQIDALYAIGYLAPVYFIGFTLVSLLKHSFLDIRSVIARSAAYISTIGILSLSYFILVVIAGGALLDLGLPARFERVFYLIFTVLLSLTFPPLKSAFDKLTNKLFYRDAYDTQVVLDHVSSIIVGNVDPHKVQKGALVALSDAIRPTYMKFLLADQNDKLREGDVVGQQWNMYAPDALQSALKRVGKKIIAYDEIEEKNSKLKNILNVEDISIVAPLITKDEAIGYLVLGPKKSGNTYNSQDIGLLNIATNELAVALQNAQRFDEIQAFNLTLQEKVTEATRELKSTNKKLVALDEAKDEFISMASHQLRTPLTSIKGYLSMMVEGDLGKVNPAQEKALKEAFGSSQRMVYLIADFLNVSRIRTGKFMIETKEVDLPQIVTEELTQLRKMAASRDLTLTYAQPGEFPRVKLDDNKIRQVMMNMVDNAIYYTPTGGTITIQLYSTGREIIFKVVDDGIGVPKVEHHKLFTKFYRASNARKSRPDGTGLGLFMSQKIVVGQGGAIIFESVEGKGSTFGFRFPLDKIRI